ncbi:MAG: ribonuclease P [Methanoregula sp.]|jgi:ribonuclease P protein subunit RPR2|nr:ribonuclease P [Methanoregula sp.]
MKERSRTPQTKKIARERLAVLFSLAQAIFSTHPALSSRYVEIARRIAMRQRIRIDREFRRQFCRHCSSFLVPGRTSRVRVHGGNVVVTCLGCKKKRRYPVGRDADNGQ